MTGRPGKDATAGDPPHPFEVGPGASGHTCTAMVVRTDEHGEFGDTCGRAASHPTHTTPTHMGEALGGLAMELTVLVALLMLVV